MRSPSDMDTVQIDITTHCPLKCSNGTQLVPHQPAQSEMSLEVFETAVKRMDGWDGPEKILGVTAGEPTLHPQFEQICRRFADLWGGPAAENGKWPIKDLNRFAAERLFDRSTGRGFGPALARVFIGASRPSWRSTGTGTPTPVRGAEVTRPS